MRIALLAAIAATAGCSTMVREESVSPTQVLAGPYELRVSVTPKAVRPGEKVVVSVEFENTGTADLWIPRRQEVFLGYSQEGTSGGYWSSSCDGIRYVRLRQKEKMRYDLPFDVPTVFGIIEVYASFRRDISAPLVVNRWYPATKEEANQTPEPTAAAGRGSS